MVDWWLQLIIPFLLSMFVVIGITVFAERFGTKLGGIFGTIPSTIVVALYFISITKGVSFGVEAAAVVPGEMAINLVFLGLIAFFIDRLRYKVVVFSLGIWGVLTFVFVSVYVVDLGVSLVLYVLAWFVVLVLLEHKKKGVAQGKKVVVYTVKMLLVRGIFAGLVIAFAVVMANFGAVLSGVFSIFPAIFLSTIIIFLKEHDSVFASGMAKSMLFGSMNVVGYVVGVFFLYPMFGVVWGSIGAFGISLCVMLCLYGLRNAIE